MLSPAEIATSVHPAAAGLPRPYQIEADWTLMSTCNYRCGYCFWDAESLGAQIAPPAPVERLASFFDRTGLTWLLHLTGGEPFVYPEFVRLCTLLTAKHLISINTNADAPHVRAFVEAVDPSRVDFVNCGAHFAERDRHHGERRFLANFAALRTAGFDVFASVVMAPELFADFPGNWQRYYDEGVVLIPKAMRGRYRARDYPAAYTDAERATFIEYSQRAAEHYAAQFARRPEPPTVNPFLDRHLFLTDRADYRGELCGAGHSFVRILTNGVVQRCGPADVIGDLVAGWFERRPGPAPCIDRHCPYFCEKYGRQRPET